MLFAKLKALATAVRSGAAKRRESGSRHCNAEIVASSKLTASFKKFPNTAL